LHRSSHILIFFHIPFLLPTSAITKGKTWLIKIPTNYGSVQSFNSPVSFPADTPIPSTLLKTLSKQLKKGTTWTCRAACMSSNGWLGGYVVTELEWYYPFVNIPLEPVIVSENIHSSWLFRHMHDVSNGVYVYAYYQNGQREMVDCSNQGVPHLL